MAILTFRNAIPFRCSHICYLCYFFFFSLCAILCMPSSVCNRYEQRPWDPNVRHRCTTCSAHLFSEI